MEIQEIEVTINKEGKVEIHMIGFKGEQCIEVTKELEHALGNEFDIREFLAEYYEENNQQNNQDYLDLHS